MDLPNIPLGAITSTAKTSVSAKVLSGALKKNKKISEKVFSFFSGGKKIRVKKMKGKKYLTF